MPSKALSFCHRICMPLKTWWSRFKHKTLLTSEQPTPLRHQYSHSSIYSTISRLSVRVLIFYEWNYLITKTESLGCSCLCGLTFQGYTWRVRVTAWLSLATKSSKHQWHGDQGTSRLVHTKSYYTNTSRGVRNGRSPQSPPWLMPFMKR